MATESPAKLQVIKFVKTAIIDKDYVFEIKGTQRDAERFVHGMRVELSRLRAEVIKRKLVPRPFKMLLYSITVIGQFQQITLRKTIDANDVSSDVDEIWDNIAGGKQIEQ